jgi:hypothetical protein
MILLWMLCWVKPCEEIYATIEEIVQHLKLDWGNVPADRYLLWHGRGREEHPLLSHSEKWLLLH